MLIFSEFKQLRENEGNYQRINLCPYVYEAQNVSHNVPLSIPFKSVVTRHF